MGETKREELVTDIINDDPWSAFDNLKSTMDWRRMKADEYPDDDRNLQAVSVIENILATRNNVSAEADAAYDKAILQVQQDESLSYNYSTATSEYRRSIGFWSFPANADEYVRDVTDLINELI